MIRFEEISKVYPGKVKAVSGISLDVSAGETLVLLGTSGSGKTTLLKMVNRLIEPSGGRILIEQQDIMDYNPVELRRRIGYAIQHIGLFPHMTVAENIAVVPQLLKWSRKNILQQTEKLLSMTGLAPDEFKDRYPFQLSGGQRQRVGVARALAADPVIVLMDEPFGALDPLTRESLQDEFIELEADIKKTILFVTHDVFEAVKMGDRVALIDNGILQQLSTPSELIENPANEFVSSFLGQHRFQLLLLTKKLKDVIKAGETEWIEQTKPEVYLDAEQSIIKALDTFGKTKTKTLPVFEGESNNIGTLAKKELLAIISDILGDISQ